MKHKILGYLFLAAAAIVVVGGIYLWQNPRIVKAPVTTNETVNWKTYTNTKYGFEFKYPSNWELIDRHLPKSDASDSLWYENLVSVTGPKVQGQAPSGTVWYVYENKAASTVANNWLNVYNAARGFKLISNQKIVFAQEDAFELVYDTGLGVMRIVVFEKNNNAFALTYFLSFTDVLSDSNDYVNKVSPLVDQILSTFKFTK
ncbi:MAG: hypothetical protein A3J07_03425 [Candidatus Doudnabacteria bacterium RIFCSPLOWO2_02_FULL_49_13]|uniref:PsbP C-terminal domain-containing protein n=1 Tax=Candidatus Doudnabacteria bacterium RIFCSPHIGHO2_12_FULL_48_16 TaxID=1817838 RepID=A0A1F5PJ49_9BACT|nr:MAG: hypothetical protein A3B77_02230 [Candidatus Doudnabacteria bacterium RIFCSPHIGHO2_02_FULL_49_24]OGE89336.1 MAG: hypothetical protein A2760_03120 [Candidatus Doudnabacteria bacterium RIFCSPHIGHO2_01_FULL_50_67]OGE89973.1 MAG: hypothetical protein A3E29_02570 [Candidatus Doudnabacteria bacterium RIFCSPHIGHO2_12_FULL_48_16]OGE97482.1 MAG: hypothetical protein A2990_02065 [Candidatus Doudnabacteria bacterium RIFCSPLOWO2_01_FULL_49_40]OGF03114.1 MAG: hypothetical protein A3J07_03425 [Candid